MSQTETLTQLLAVLLGVASLVLPAQASSNGSVWGALAIVWGVAFVAAAELTTKQASG